MGKHRSSAWEKPIGSEEESLSKRVRETVSGLSNEDLLDMLNSEKAPSFTAFARRVAREEISRRLRAKADHARPSEKVMINPGPFRPDSPADRRHGCYVELWSDKNFEGEYLRIEGPVECGALDSIRPEWCDTASSLRMGPTAFALVYPEQGFEGTMWSFGPGQEVPDLKELSCDNEIDSINLVSSLRIFDGLRMEDTGKPVAQAPEQKERERG